MYSSYKRWFNESIENQEIILLNYLPSGRIYKKAYSAGTNFNLVIKWMAKSFYRLVFAYNRTFKGLFICKSSYLMSQYMVDYNIPNNIFYEADEYTYIRDLYVLKYLMKGNTKWHYKAIANIYGVKVKVLPGIIINFEERDFSQETNPIDAEEKYLKLINKILNIYDIISPIQSSITYNISAGVYDPLIEFDCESFDIDPYGSIGAIESFEVNINTNLALVGDVTMSDTKQIEGYELIVNNNIDTNSGILGEIIYEG